MELEQQLRAALAPHDPGLEFTAGVMGKIARRRARRPGRVILFGAVAAVAAAAAMLAVRLADSLDGFPASTTETTVVRTPAIDPAPDVFPAVPRSVGEAGEQTDQATGNKEEEVATQKSAGFTVRLLPLQNEATDAPSRAAVDTFYTAWLDGLRTVPGLTLIAPDSTGFTEDSPADYEITIKGTGPVSGKGLTIDGRVVMIGSDGQRRSRSTGAFTGWIAPACAGADSSCVDPVSMAGTQVARLQKDTFPQDGSLLRELRAQFLDPVLEPRQRLNALAQLVSNGVTASSVSGSTGAVVTRDVSALREPIVVLAAIDLATRSADPTVRAQVWGAMRGVRSAHLVQPLITSLRQDSDGEVRVNAMATLAADFGDDQRVRAALEAAAREDSRPLVRSLAQRALSGNNEAWNEYVATSLKDANRPEAERIEAFFRHVHESGMDSDLRKLLDDDEAVKALADVLPRVFATPMAGVSRTFAQTRTLLVSLLGPIDHPAATGMLLDIFDHSAEPIDRDMALAHLTLHRSDPSVRAMLEKVAAGDPDPRLRETAAGALKLPAGAQSPTR